MLDTIKELFGTSDLYELLKIDEKDGQDSKKRKLKLITVNQLLIEMNIR